MALKGLSTPEERDLILPWRNAPEVRRAMYRHHVISPEEHSAWFERMQTDARCQWYLHRDAEGTPDGVVYFTDIDTAHKTAFWGFYARPGAPAGTGTRILYEALNHAFDELGLYKVNGEVLDGNSTSLHLHKKCGFKVEGTFRAQHFDGEQRVGIIRLGLLANEWATHREIIRSRIEHFDTLNAQHKSVRHSTPS
ncbi:UDP-4-amino-4,6-dideoxy-N-acetyl-beta-L-altrosamine N-acetyltransferase [Ectothiorhodospira lacustris]|uniref:UDP-4-amino-4, 6-dideoxy-N-acetyl-beta-L-altrosamine N-acetyltransferase n=1 Tax=Ectothiorhodospira lacustris TaxID=2899127 RepID=UPI001EE94BE1|nr:UDP-4-amino-4,6-dideoxy-N-acetyl-beta-L-altrosamine N-acetyltransferase [Ectothiorhodospira lacustris]MCG5501462.1 UDP-4-amino-4,6-dideoxy-N-acetyl-beta-L-altrosamine N-acetyltransferase [Ectothiorhodospira lacustris]